MKLMEVATAQLRVQIGHQWHQDGGHQLHEARIAHQGGKLAAQMTLDILGVIGFERSIMGLMKQDHNGHEFAGVHLGRAQALSLSRRQQCVVPVWCKLLPEIVYGTKQFEYTHSRNLLRIDTDVHFVLSYQEVFLIPNSR